MWYWNSQLLSSNGFSRQVGTSGRDHSLCGAMCKRRFFKRATSSDSFSASVK
ncbi:hypothetical protein ACFOLD_01885 [Kocuria carniphila]|uniref:hypothetical protein n=1 Tax=Kocuria carniphila TaxID=262208 RepID=UPI00362374DB